LSDLSCKRLTVWKNIAGGTYVRRGEVRSYSGFRNVILTRWKKSMNVQYKWRLLESLKESLHERYQYLNIQTLPNEMMPNSETFKTHRSKELLHVRRICVNNQLEDLFVSDFPQDLPVGCRARLTNVHFSSHGWRGFYEILQFEQPCKNRREIFFRSKLVLGVMPSSIIARACYFF